MFDEDGPTDVLHEYVYEGVWDMFPEPAFRRRIWTLKDSKAFLILACLTILIAFTQTRAWVLMRYIIFRRTKSVRLPGDIKPDARQHLSQTGAIIDTLPTTTTVISSLQILFRRVFRIRTGHQDPPLPSDCPVVSPWFGVFALLNVVLFVTMGVAIPWFLSEGALEAPIVKSRTTDKCLTSVKYEHVMSIIAQLPRTDAIFQQCLDRLNEGCDTQYYLQQPQIQKKRVEDCPFLGNICHNGTKPFEITHSNITAYEAGVNSMSTLTLNHRLTCVPVYLDSFLLFTLEQPQTVQTFISVQNFELVDTLNDLRANLSMSLNTMNGPTSVSNESSGLRMAQEKGPYDLTILPRYFAGSEDIFENPKLLHANLQGDDGMSFLIVHRAGATNYYEQIEDPFFAAHNEIEPGSDPKKFYADYEATALGCLEQFQYCRRGSDFCTPWGSRSDQSRSMARHALTEQDLLSWAEIYVWFRVLPSLFSVFDYLAMRTEWHTMVPLTRSGLSIDMSAWLANPYEQWVTEVEKWFMKGILDAILSVRRGAQFHMKDFDPEIIVEFKSLFGIDFVREFSLCGRILFRDGKYTNINWIGLWATTGSTIFICLLSYSVAWIYEIAPTLLKRLSNPRRFLVKLFAVVETLRRLARNARWRSTVDLWDRLSRLRRSPLSFQPFASRRTWYGTRVWDGSTQSTSELDDIEPASIAPESRGKDSNESYENIDNILPSV